MESVSGVEGRGVIVVGGGVAGLVAAVELARRGATVTVLEREDRVGGLARSFRYDGMTFDIGPHRFHTDDGEVERVVLEALGRDHRIIDRSSAVWLYEAYHDWPLTRSSLLKLPPLVMARAFLDLFRRSPPRDESLEAYVLSRYGRTLYDIFFRPYTEKFLNYACGELHRDWASAGIDRAVIDKRLRFDSLWHVARTTLLAPKVRTRFVYPDSGGIDRFGEALAGELRALGGRVLTGAEVRSLRLERDRVVALGAGDLGELEADLVVWTAPLPRLLELAGLEGGGGLRFLAELMYNVVLDHDPLLPYQWTYYGGAALSFTRASVPACFNPANARPGRSGVCVEVVCTEGDETWREPERLRRAIESDLVKVGLARSRAAVADVHVEPVREAYPIYTLDYPARLARAIGAAGRLDNVALLGRGGTFWYNNMDHSIRAALDLARALAAGESPGSWNRGLRERRAL